MKYLNRYSIKQKLIILQLAATFAILLFYSIFYLIRDSRFYLASIQRELSSITELTGFSSVSTLHFYDKGAAKNILSTLEVEKQVVNAWIHDADGELFAEYSKTGYQNFKLDSPPNKTFMQDKNFLIMSKPIVYENETIGFISIRYDMKTYNELIFKSKIATLYIFLVGMAAAWILALFTQKTISNPIRKLLKTMKKISTTDDYSLRPVKERDDEIGSLSDGICEMLDQIQIHDSEKNQAHIALHESEEKYRNLIERANDGITILQDGVFRYVNPSLVEMADCSEKELIGVPFINFISEDEIPKVMEFYKKRMSGEKISSIYETRFKTYKGEIIDAEVNAGFVTYQGKPADLVFIRNISERKQIEKELKKHRDHLEEMVTERTAELEVANERLLELDRMKSMFLASMSHELRTPLNSIIGFTGILLMEMAGELNPEQKKQLNMVKSSSKHLLELINDILDISKIESGKVKLDIEKFNLTDVVHQVLKELQPLAERKELLLSVNDVDKINIESDRRRVKQILMNLAGNSIKFTDNGSVTINIALLKNKNVSIMVKDTGIGIKEDEIKKLFQPFQQMDMTSTKKYEGTGLGLYLSKKIMTLLHGEIFVNSKYGQGSEFTFTLPFKWDEENGNEKNFNY